MVDIDDCTDDESRVVEVGWLTFVEVVGPRLVEEDDTMVRGIFDVKVEGEVPTVLDGVLGEG